jgi:hypothetical protein
MDDINSSLKPSPFFQELEEKTVRSEKITLVITKFFQSFGYYLRQVWPYIYRLINFLVYETIKVIKGIVKIAIQQVGMFK